MDYIVLDLEWNQAYAQKAIAVQKRLAARLRGEVIQIGAVKLNQSKQIVGSFSMTVKPKYFCKIHRHVRDLTGITQEMMDAGASLEEAVEKFRAFCGAEVAFLTWGPDDIPMLQENLVAHKLPDNWLAASYDLQVMFNTETEGKGQKSLEFAMEHFAIPMTLPAHDALNDAYFTALVAQRLDIAEGIRRSSAVPKETLSDEIFGDSNIGERGYEDINTFLKDKKAVLERCPLCGGTITCDGKALHCKGHRYLTPYTCPTDGSLMLQIKMFRNFDETWRAKKNVVRATEDMLADYRARLEENSGRKRRRPRKRGAKKTETASAKEAN